MAVDLNNALADDILDLLDTAFPAGSILELRTAAPAGAENAAGGVLLASITLPATPWAAASAGSKSKNGTWADTAVAAGTIGHWRLKNPADTRRLEGLASAAGGGGEVIVNNLVTAIGQAVVVDTFAIYL